MIKRDNDSDSFSLQERIADAPLHKQDTGNTISRRLFPQKCSVALSGLRFLFGLGQVQTQTLLGQRLRELRALCLKIGCVTAAQESRRLPCQRLQTCPLFPRQLRLQHPNPFVARVMNHCGSVKENMVDNETVADDKQDWNESFHFHLCSR